MRRMFLILVVIAILTASSVDAVVRKFDIPGSNSLPAAYIVAQNAANGKSTSDANRYICPITVYDTIKYGSVTPKYQYIMDWPSNNPSCNGVDLSNGYNFANSAAVFPNPLTDSLTGKTATQGDGSLLYALIKSAGQQVTPQNIPNEYIFLRGFVHDQGTRAATGIKHLSVNYQLDGQEKAKVLTERVNKTKVDNFANLPVLTTQAAAATAAGSPKVPIMDISFCGERLLATWDKAGGQGNTITPTKATFIGQHEIEFCSPSSTNLVAGIHNIAPTNHYIDFFTTSTYGANPYTFPLKRICDGYSIQVTHGFSGGWNTIATNNIIDIPVDYSSSPVIPRVFFYKKAASSDYLYVKLTANAASLRLEEIKIEEYDLSSAAGGSRFLLYCNNPVDPDNQAAFNAQMAKITGGTTYTIDQYCKEAGIQGKDSGHWLSGSGCCGDDPTDAGSKSNGYTCTYNAETVNPAFKDVYQWIDSTQLTCNSNGVFTNEYGCCDSNSFGYVNTGGTSPKSAVCVKTAEGDGVTTQDVFAWVSSQEARNSPVPIAPSGPPEASFVADDTNFYTCWNLVQYDPFIPSPKKTFDQSCGACVPTPEVCDGEDNDCDTIVDNGIDCSICANQIEACDGIDNNCNGQIDEGCQTCVPTNEICDGIDNNCNTQIDEGIDCSACIKKELCGDGIDNNCNGQTDEGCV